MNFPSIKTSKYNSLRYFHCPVFFFLSLFLVKILLRYNSHTIQSLIRSVKFNGFQYICKLWKYYCNLFLNIFITPQRSPCSLAIIPFLWSNLWQMSSLPKHLYQSLYQSISIPFVSTIHWVPVSPCPSWSLDCLISFTCIYNKVFSSGSGKKKSFWKY
jgi:hypothetical protein